MGDSAGSAIAAVVIVGFPTPAVAAVIIAGLCGTGVPVGTVVSLTVPVGAGDGTAVATDEVTVDGLVGDRDGRGLGWCVIAATRRRQCSDGERHDHSHRYTDRRGSLVSHDAHVPNSPVW